MVDFPNEHWYEHKIRHCFRAFCNVAEIDPESLTRENFGPMRLLLELNDRLEIPLEVRISSKLGVGRIGAVAKILPIRVWPREYQLDSQGNLARFFGPPAPPPQGPSLGPMGPMSSQQQLRPQTHFYSQMFPPHAAPQNAHNLQYAFDPLHSSPQPAAPLTPLPAPQFLGLALAFARLLSTLAVTAPSEPVMPSEPAAAEPLPNPESPAPPASATSPVSAKCPASPRRADGPALITFRRRRLRSAARPAGPLRTSSRLAAKAPAEFIDMTTQAVQHKALLNSLSGCSKTLKKHVSRRNILSRNLLPLSGTDLRKLVSAAKLRCNNVDSVAVVSNAPE